MVKVNEDTESADVYAYIDAYVCAISHAQKTQCRGMQGGHCPFHLQESEEGTHRSFGLVNLDIFKGVSREQQFIRSRKKDRMGKGTWRQGLHLEWPNYANWEGVS